MYKATIVIPNINGKGWLKDSIESVYAQTEQSFRLIVVDNGSTDESLEQDFPSHRLWQLYLVSIQQPKKMAARITALPSPI